MPCAVLANMADPLCTISKAHASTILARRHYWLCAGLACLSALAFAGCDLEGVQGNNLDGSYCEPLLHATMEGEEAPVASFDEATRIVLPDALEVQDGSLQGIERFVLKLELEMWRVACVYDVSEIGDLIRFAGCVRSEEADARSDCAESDTPCDVLGVRAGDALDILSASLHTVGTPLNATVDVVAQLGNICASGAPEARPAEICDSGSDEDGDGDIDCADSDCIAKEMCRDAFSEGLTVTTPFTFRQVPTVLEAEAHVSDLRVSAHGLNFRTSDDTVLLEIGQAVAGASQGGFLRRITALHPLPGGRVQALTTPLAVSDVFETGSFALEVSEEAWAPLAASDPLPSPMAMQAFVSEPFDFEESPCEAQMAGFNVRPIFEFTPRVSGDLDIVEGELISARADVGGTLQVGGALAGQLEGSASCSFSRSLTGYRMAQIIWVPTPALVPFPILIVHNVYPQLNFGAELSGDAGHVATRLEGRVSLDGNAVIAREGSNVAVRGSSGGTGNFSYTPPANKADNFNLTLSAGVEAVYGADFYGLAGPHAGLGASLRGTVRTVGNCEWEGTADLLPTFSLGLNIPFTSVGPSVLEGEETRIFETRQALGGATCDPNNPNDGDQGVGDGSDDSDATECPWGATPTPDGATPCACDAANGAVILPGQNACQCDYTRGFRYNPYTDRCDGCNGATPYWNPQRQLCTQCPPGARANPGGATACACDTEAGFTLVPGTDSCACDAAAGSRLNDAGDACESERSRPVQVTVQGLSWGNPATWRTSVYPPVNAVEIGIPCIGSLGTPSYGYRIEAHDRHGNPETFMRGSCGDCFYCGNGSAQFRHSSYSIEWP